MVQYSHFLSKPLMNRLMIFATVHSLMKDTNLIDSCQAHLPLQYALNTLWALLTLLERGSILDSMNIPKIEFIS